MAHWDIECLLFLIFSLLFKSQGTQPISTLINYFLLCACGSLFSLSRAVTSSHFQKSMPFNNRSGAVSFSSLFTTMWPAIFATLLAAKQGG